MLESLDLTKTLTEEEYERRLQPLQLELVLQQRQLAERGIPVVIVFEGMDAAGKGGAIRRLTTKWDPRGYSVYPIGPPDAHELSYHYLRRFWDRLPSYGRIVIFDRSWYGRVLVERVEELTPEARWREGFEEICEFERMLVNDGTILLKFWLHISQNEQLKRFKAREDDPYKRWKITKEDWRNREKWGPYVAAAEEMIARTSPGYSPWIVVPAEDKRFARILVLESVRDALAVALERCSLGNERLAPVDPKRAAGARSVFEAAPAQPPPPKKSGKKK